MENVSSQAPTAAAPQDAELLTLFAMLGGAAEDAAHLEQLLARACDAFGLLAAGIYAAAGDGLILRAVAGADCGLLPREGSELAAACRRERRARQTGGALAFPGAGGARMVFEARTARPLAPAAESALERLAGPICQAALALYSSENGANSALQKQLIEAQKMQVVGTLTAGIAHDFNNLLTTILGQIELLRLRHGRVVPEDALERLGRIERAGRRAAGLVSQLLAFSRHDPRQMGPVDVWAAVLATVELLKHGLPENIEIRREARIAEAKVWGSLGQLQQALINMATNSVVAMPQGGAFTIVLDAAAPPAAATTEAPGWIALTVSDTGVGMSEAVRQRIFEPFFSTKASTDSAGLGLAIVHGIVEAHHGHVEVESTPGKGTTFRLYLPLHRADAAAPPMSPAQEQQGKEKILLVEDDPAVAETTAQMLASLGYRVMTALKPSDALRLVAAQEHRFDMMITDVTMPEMTGYQLAERLRREFGPMRVLFVTGYDFNASSVPTSRFLLQKPLSLQALGEGVRQVLASHAA